MVKEVLGTSLDLTGVLDRRIGKRINGVFSWLVPMYHRIINDVQTEDPYRLGMCVHAKTFDAQLKYFKENYKVLPVADVVSAQLSGNQKVENLVSITFDDGYRDNLKTALPLLEKYEIPATIFIATTILKGNYLWWDQMVALFSSTNDKTISFSEDSSGKQFPNTSSGLADLLSFLWEQGHSDRMDLVSSLLKKYNISGKSENLYLSPEELKALSDHPLIEIGAHTVNHQNLSKLDEEGANDEIGGSINELESLIGKPIKTFAYPRLFCY